MTVGDIIVLALVVTMLFFVIRRLIKNKGGCSCGCGSCNCSCGSKKSAPEEKK